MSWMLRKQIYVLNLLKLFPNIYFLIIQQLLDIHKAKTNSNKQKVFTQVLSFLPSESIRTINIGSVSARHYRASDKGGS